jgi:type VI secretion system secreted protein Hcp
MHSVVAHRAVVVCLALTFIPGLAFAGDQIFLTISGVHGDASGGSIQVLSVSGGVSNEVGRSTSVSAARAGAPNFSDFSLQSQTSSASPILQQSVASGRSYSQAVVSFVRQTGGGPQFAYLTYTLSNVNVTSWSFGAAEGGNFPTENVSLAYTRIATRYQPQNPDGTPGTPVLACWDLTTNRSCL